MAKNYETVIPKVVRRFMPGASETELREAAEAFNEYLVVVWEIFQRIEREQTGNDLPNSEVPDRVNNTD
jgi:hypothetical protein